MATFRKRHSRKYRNKNTRRTKNRRNARKSHIKRRSKKSLAGGNWFIPTREEKERRALRKAEEERKERVRLKSEREFKARLEMQKQPGNVSPDYNQDSVEEKEKLAVERERDAAERRKMIQEVKSTPISHAWMDAEEAYTTPGAR